MATLIIHGTVPIKVPFTVKWWWDSWHESGFLDAMAKVMRSVPGVARDDVWKVNGVPVSQIDALTPHLPTPWEAAMDPNKLLELMDPRRMPDAEQYMVHKGHFMWSGSDMDSERQRAGEALARYLNKIHALAPREPIRIVAHSHGCNVVKVASSSERLDPAIRIERAVFLACPHFRLLFGRREVFPYRLDPARFGWVLNVFSPQDSVQVDIAQGWPGPPEGAEQVLGVLHAARSEQDPTAQNIYRNYEVPTEDQGVRAHSALHGWRMGALVGFWLGCEERQFDEPYREAFANGIFPIPAGDHGE